MFDLPTPIAAPGTVLCEFALVDTGISRQLQGVGGGLECLGCSGEQPPPGGYLFCPLRAYVPNHAIVEKFPGIAGPSQGWSAGGV